jgi:arylsulfatase A-like enzyme
MNGFYEITEMRQNMSYPWRADLISKGYEFDSYDDVYSPVSSTGSTLKLNDPALYSADDSDTAFLTNEFLNKIAAYKGESWFAHLTYIRPHPPLVAPAPYNTMYDSASLPTPSRMETADQEQEIHPFFSPAHEYGDISKFVEGFPDLEPTDENVQTLRSLYFGLATEVDHHLGRVFDYLKSSEQYDDTLIVFTADHGEMLGDRHAWGKMSIYDAAYHTPLIIRDPKNTNHAGSKITEVTESIDITPTILSWLGQNVPDSMDGRTLNPMLQGETPQDWRKYSYSELDFSDPIVPTLWQQQLGTNQSNSNLCILRDKRFTLVHFAADLPPLLFDNNGNGEMENVATKPEMQSDLMRLTQMMLSHRMAHMDHTLSTNSITDDGVQNAPRYMI